MRIELFSFPPFGDMNPNNKPTGRAAMAVVPEVEIEIEAPPSFSTEQLEMAERSGFEKGYAQGYASAHSELKDESYEREKNIAALVESIRDNLAQVSHLHNAYLQEQNQDITRLCLGIAKKIAGEALAASPMADIEPLINKCLGMLISEPKATIYVNGALLKALESRVETIMSGSAFVGDIIVQEDALLGIADCRIEWKNGMAQRNSDQIWNSIEAIILSEKTNTATAAQHQYAEDAEATSKMYIANG